jgi:pyruvyltransferase
LTSAIPTAEAVPAFWCRIPSRPNFGDALTPWLIRHITGRSPVFVPPGTPRNHYLVTGSVVAYAGSFSTVWGAGIMNRNDTVSPEATYLAVRGPLTRSRALECGAQCPEVFGDPAMLLPRFYQATVSTRKGMGLALHFSDFARLGDALRRSDEFEVIDMQAPVERVIDQLAGCEVVASSSLHGLIAAQAYGTPAVWVKFRDLPSGDDSKFRDYLLATDQQVRGPVWLDEHNLELSPAFEEVSSAPRPRLDGLWNACPFKARA